MSLQHSNTGVARGVHGPIPPKFFADPVILCFENRRPKQNAVAHLKLQILSTSKFFAPLQKFGLAAPLHSNIRKSHNWIV